MMGDFSHSKNKDPTLMVKYEKETLHFCHLTLFQCTQVTTDLDCEQKSAIYLRQEVYHPQKVRENSISLITSIFPVLQKKTGKVAA